MLADFGVSLPPTTEIRVWDSTAETRFLVLPMRPRRNRWLERGQTRDAGHAGLHDRHRLARKAKRGCLMDGIHDMGGMDGFGKVDPEPNEPVFHEAWEGRVLAMNRGDGRVRQLGTSIWGATASNRFHRMSIWPAPTTRGGFSASSRCSFSAAFIESRRDSGWPRVASRQDA